MSVLERSLQFSSTEETRILCRLHAWSLREVLSYSSKWLRGSESQMQKEHSISPVSILPAPGEEGHGGPAAGQSSGPVAQAGLGARGHMLFQKPAALKGTGSFWAV